MINLWTKKQQCSVNLVKLFLKCAEWIIRACGFFKLFLLQQNNMQTKQRICGVDLTFIRKMVRLLLLVYNSAAVHNSLIRWSTGTTRAGWVGLLLWECKTKKLIFYLTHMVLTTSLVPDICTHIWWREKCFPFLSFISFIQPKESNQNHFFNNLGPSLHIL